MCEVSRCPILHAGLNAAIKSTHMLCTPPNYEHIATLQLYQLPMHPALIIYPAMYTSLEYCAWLHNWGIYDIQKLKCVCDLLPSCVNGGHTQIKVMCRALLHEQGSSPLLTCYCLLYWGSVSGPHSLSLSRFSIHSSFCSKLQWSHNRSTAMLGTQGPEFIHPHTHSYLNSHIPTIHTFLPTQ